MKRILIVEDDMSVREGLRVELERDGYKVRAVADGLQGYQSALEEGYELIVLDLMLPSKCGEAVCEGLRARGCETPILMLTGRVLESEKVAGLEMGADDYLTKPFSLAELRARIKALLRRRRRMEREVEEASFGDIRVDFLKHKLYRQRRRVPIGAREMRVLRYLLQHEGDAVTRQALLVDVWGYRVKPKTRTVDNFILSLRKAIERDPARPRHIRTVHGVGYRFVREGDSEGEEVEGTALQVAETGAAGCFSASKEREAP
jgi:DNA-binding response OmpR family regulator